MNRSILKAVIVILIALLPASLLQAQRAKGPNRMQVGKRMLEQLNLTPDQKDQIAKLRTENQKKMIDLKSEIQKTRLEIKDQMRQKDPDESKILDLTKKISSIQSEMKQNAISTWFKSYRLLDDKQKEVFKKFAPMLRASAGEMRGRGQRGMNRGNFQE